MIAAYVTVLYLIALNVNAKYMTAAYLTTVYYAAQNDRLWRTVLNLTITDPTQIENQTSRFLMNQAIT